MMKRKEKVDYARWIFVLPALLVVGVLLIYPIFSSLYYSMTSKHLIRLTYDFIGMANYKEVLTDPNFYKAFLNSILWTIGSLLGQLFIGFTAALAINRVKVGKGIYRTLMIIPWAFPSIVIALSWKWILNGDTGVLNAFLKGIGLSSLAQPWLGSAKTALGSILAVGFPWLGMVSLGGMPFLLYFGALQSIPRDLFEAADLDGVNLFQRIRCIDLPMLASQIKLMVTLAIINSLQIFDVVFILTKGGPGTSTMVPAVYMYEQGFSYRRMGYCSALGTILFLLIMLLTVFNNKFLKNTETMD